MCFWSTSEPERQRFANSGPAAQRVVDDIGGVHNLQQSLGLASPHSHRGLGWVGAIQEDTGRA